MVLAKKSPLTHPVFAAGRGLECLDDAQGYANPGATMLDRLGSRDLTNRDASQWDWGPQGESTSSMVDPPCRLSLEGGELVQNWPY